MLTELHVKNLALIETLDLELKPGLNVLTGETGAGKSIVIDAVYLLLGGRASQEFIRSGADKAFVEGLFSLESSPEIVAYLADLGYELEENTLLLCRELSVSGRNTCRVQGRSVPLNLYKQIGELLVDIHGQHDYQSLLRPETHANLLDSLADDLKPLKQAVAQAAEHVIQINTRLAELVGDDKELARREDMLRFQLDEIAAAGLQTGEEEELQQERSRLANAQKLAVLGDQAYDQLNGNLERQKPALDLVGLAVSSLREITSLDVGVGDLLSELESVYYQLEEISRELRSYGESIVFDQERQDWVEERLALIRSLGRKYGNSIAEINAYYAEATAELDTISNQKQLVAELQTELITAEKTYRQRAESLSLARQRVAQRLESSVGKELAALNMPDTVFKVEFHKREKVHKNGQDLIEFMFSANRGEAVKPLAKTASGGEMSRVILALKTLLAKVDPVPTLVFDEVDSGVGGSAVRKMAEKLAQIGLNKQVLCVTHSPHVASFAARHLSVRKEVVKERTVVRVKPLQADERREELARMLGGAPVTDLTLRHAAELLKLAQQTKTAG